MDSFNERYLNYSKPFIEGLKNVYSTMLKNDIVAGKPSIKKDRVSLGDITSIMSMNGVYKSDSGDKKFTGSFIISWPKDSFLKAAESMVGEAFTDITEEIEDVAGEITNITMGNAKKYLSDFGYQIEMSIPTILKGKSEKLADKNAQVITISIPFVGDLGQIFMEINYSEES